MGLPDTSCALTSHAAISLRGLPVLLELYLDSANDIYLSRSPQSQRSEGIFLCYLEEALLFVHLDPQSI